MPGRRPGAILGASRSCSEEATVEIVPQRPPVTPSPAAVRLAWAIAAGALVAALAGVLAGGGPGRHDVATLHGRIATLYGEGLYRHDTFLVGAGNRGTDVATLLVEIPVLAAAALVYRRASLRAALVLGAALSYFLYLYASMTFATAYNRLFALYVALFAASLGALVLVVRSIDARALASRFPDRPSPRALASYLYAVAGLLVLVWGSSLVAALVTGDPPSTLATYTSETTWALDLGLVAPLAVLAAALVRRRDPVGYLLASLMLGLNVAIGVALMAQGAAQVAFGVPLSTGEIVGKMLSFAALTILAAILLGRVLRGLRATPQPAATRVTLAGRGRAGTGRSPRPSGRR
jgi:hypothetical protein